MSSQPMGNHGGEFSDVVSFDLGLLLQGQMGIAKLKNAYSTLIIFLEVGNVKPIYRNHRLGIFQCCHI